MKAHETESNIFTQNLIFRAYLPNPIVTAQIRITILLPTNETIYYEQTLKVSSSFSGEYIIGPRLTGTLLNIIVLPNPAFTPVSKCRIDVYTGIPVGTSPYITSFIGTIILERYQVASLFAIPPTKFASIAKLKEKTTTSSQPATGLRYPTSPSDYTFYVPYSMELQLTTDATPGFRFFSIVETSTPYAKIIASPFGIPPSSTTQIILAPTSIYDTTASNKLILPMPNLNILPLSWAIYFDNAAPGDTIDYIYTIWEVWP